jgi:hypothetical protein
VTYFVDRNRSSVRKKLLSTLNVLPEGIETIGSSSSQDEADVEEVPAKFRKRRKMLRKTRVKRQKGIVSVTNHLLSFR